ncbi:MAG: lipoyl synthase [Candidatus Kapaibacterium sp.]
MTKPDTNSKKKDNTAAPGPDQRPRRPEWLKVKAPGGENFARVRKLMRSKALHTVCEEAHCPNISECWNHGTATFIILGDRCSRNCRFCAVETGGLLPADTNEPTHVAESIESMKLRHAVVTSVTRDDLPDGGSEIWAATIREIRRLNPDTTIEVLIPDMKADKKLLRTIFAERPDILNHNVETVPRLYSEVRPQADYQWSLDVLRQSKEFGLKTKTGIMVGLGETFDEVIDVMKDLRKINTDIMTIGQYLQPSKKHRPVDRYVHPDEFDDYRRTGEEMGFETVESAPLVRSSYHAERHV